MSDEKNCAEPLSSINSLILEESSHYLRPGEAQDPSATASDDGSKDFIQIPWICLRRLSLTHYQTGQTEHAFSRSCLSHVLMMNLL